MEDKKNPREKFEKIIGGKEKRDDSLFFEGNRMFIRVIPLIRRIISKMERKKKIKLVINE